MASDMNRSSGTRVFVYKVIIVITEKCTDMKGKYNKGDYNYADCDIDKYVTLYKSSD